MKPDFAIVNERVKDGYTTVCIDTSKATFRGIKWRTLGDFGKRKFQNLLIITRSKERLKFIYQ